MATFSNSLIRIKSSKFKFIFRLFYQQNSATKSVLIVLQNTHKKKSGRKHIIRFQTPTLSFAAEALRNIYGRCALFRGANVSNKYNARMRLIFLMQQMKT
jgi:hypothetical protein